LLRSTCWAKDTVKKSNFTGTEVLQLTSRGGRSISPLFDKSRKLAEGEEVELRRYLLEWLEGWNSWFGEYCGGEGSVMLLPSSLPSVILFAYRVPLLCYFLWQTKFNFDFYSFGEDRFRACAVTVMSENHCACFSN